LVDAVAVIRRGQQAVFIALRLEAVPGRLELIELLYQPSCAEAGEGGSCSLSRVRAGDLIRAVLLFGCVTANATVPVELVDDVEHEPGQVVARQPVAQIRL
jgi:hypothetical protein